ncbi:similar to Saccharomyces cerevisiae YDL220C CDC13 Single stranded DNA-binding protein found at TG1-3 telomere G-tails [Maudiozyma saulgeensis]|uniref:Similar to Saccharomyces cerevisiae YDL220C CDC13 Single stranded DNA-binding protein found at TG1-3 telomere G-tails n=1 Tax=Maudiozyma saulgeensis TaxID=1789683 RepID=A0A1X7R6V4_9SACH|nr:similar to Saccharomyces cerevisiae YDL220C CDC13 Single stranded DNA-binding protein found at TG1-3 telomere G-tails [Kazachstania saulgeensis]
MEQEDGYTIIDNLEDIERIPAGKCIRIRFVAVLQDIVCTKSSLSFHLATFNDNDDTFITRINIKDTFARRNAMFAFSLLKRTLNFNFLQFPIDNQTVDWKRRDIHINELRLVVVSTTFVTNGSKSSLFLDDLIPLNLIEQADIVWKYLQSNTVHVENDWLTPRVAILFKRLCKLDAEDKSLFQFKNLKNIEFQQRNDCLQKIINFYQSANKKQQCRSITGTSRAILPIYKPIDTFDSQNEFNSQAMDTQTSLNVAPIIKKKITPFKSPEFNPQPQRIAQQSNENAFKAHMLEHGPSKQQQPVKNVETVKNLEDLRPKAFAFMDLGSVSMSTAKFVGTGVSYGDMDDTYLIPSQMDNLTNPTNGNLLEPYINCVAVRSTKESTDILDQFVDTDIEANLNATKYKMGTNDDSPYTIVPQLKSYKVPDKTIPGKEFSLPSPREKFIQWQDISITDQFPQYVKIIAVLLGFSNEHSNYYDLIFTDFTTNQTNHKYLFDRSFLAGNTTISYDQGFRTLMYHNQLENFETELKVLTNKDIIGLANSSLQDNLSHNGIVCELTIKVTVYQDKLNLILRECTPLTRSLINSRNWYNDKTALENLHSLYQRTFDFCSQNCLSLGLDNTIYKNFAKFFPMKRTDEIPGAVIVIPKDEIYRESHSDNDDTDDISKHNDNNNASIDSSTNKTYSYIPNLNIDITSFEITNETENFTSLYKTQTNMNNLFIVDNLKLLSWKLIENQKVLILNVTNDLVSSERIEQTRILPLYIINDSNLKYFCNGCFNAHSLTTDLNKMIGQKFSFKIKTGRLKLNDKYLLKIYCPIECTLAELISQWEVYRLGQEMEKKYGDYDNIMVKLEK